MLYVLLTAILTTMFFSAAPAYACYAEKRLNVALPAKSRRIIYGAFFAHFVLVVFTSALFIGALLDPITFWESWNIDGALLLALAQLVLATGLLSLGRTLLDVTRQRQGSIYLVNMGTTAIYLSWFHFAVAAVFFALTASAK